MCLATRACLEVSISQNFSVSNTSFPEQWIGGGGGGGVSEINIDNSSTTKHTQLLIPSVLTSYGSLH